MPGQPFFRLLFCCLALTGLVLAPAIARGHGGVVEEEDVCVIKINYFKGHFKIYQPRTDGQQEYCEDLPNATESVFVMEYLHDGLAEVPVDFRIIRDVTGKGRFARWEDVAAIDDLDAATVFYQPPVIEPDVFTVLHDFDEEGDYIGVVTANVADTGNVYRAVFPFEVGYTGLGYWPLIIGIALLIQIQYFVMSGRWKRWSNQRRRPRLEVVLLLLFIGARADASGETWMSERDLFSVQFESSLDPIEINRMHSWQLTIKTASGDPVAGANVAIDGGMPEHNHGLPSRPRVTRDYGDGRYTVEGIRFHMAGLWEMSVQITYGGRSDTVKIILEL